MRRTASAVSSIAIFSLTIAIAVAQQHDPKTHGQAHGGTAARDPRELVAIPPDLATHMMANMRDHLAALQEIQNALARGQNDVAAKVAEQRLGMTSLTSHGAHEVGKFMPRGMQDAGSGMHRAASKFAIAVQDSGVTGDLKPALAALAEVTAQCVGCHAGYRIK